MPSVTRICGFCPYGVPTNTIPRWINGTNAVRIDAAFDVGAFALFAGCAYLLARRMRLETRVSLGPGPSLQ